MAPLQHCILLLGAALVVCTQVLSHFTCDGGATTLEENSINDNYCDCRDGTDETRTPACSHVAQSRFFCADTGALNQTIPTSRVWDGVCDCCDGSDELVGSRGLGRYERWAAGAGSAAAGAETVAACDRNGCERLLEEERAKAIDAYQSVQVGLVARAAAEEESERAVARWEAALRAGEIDDGVRKEELKAVEKLEVLLKVYLQDEERLERRERIQLAQGGRCSSSSSSNNNPRREGGGEGKREKNNGAEGTGGRPAAAALGPCEDKSAEREAAAKVRAARAAARAQLDAKEEEEQQQGRGKAGRSKKRRGRDGAGGKKGGRESRNSNRRSSHDDGLEGATTADDILELHWPVDVGASDDDISSSDGDSRESAAAGEEGRGRNQKERAAGEARSVPMLSLKTYVKQRQAGSGGVAPEGGGSAAAAQTEEKKAEELRKTALLGPVLNDGERGVYLGLTILLRMAGLPLLAPLRGLMALCGLARDQMAGVAASLAADYVLPTEPPSSPPSYSSWMARGVVGALEGYRDRGLPGISPHLDYRRYPTLRSVVLRWDEFLDGNGKFLMVMWDAPVALWDFFLPARDDEHERPEAAMLREGIARAKAILREGKADDAARGGAGAGDRGKRRQEEKEAKRLLGLDLGQHSRFAALAEKCLELEESGYKYSLCPFKEAKQDRNILGRWRGWERAEPGGRAATMMMMMMFDGGSRCHNGKLRSCEVRVECGSEDALTAAEEVEICLYRLTLGTPLACTEAALREAEERLEAFGGRLGLKSEEGGDLPGLDGSGDGGGGGAAGSVPREEL